MRTLHSRQYQIFISVLRDARLAAALTQRDLAARLGKPQSYVSKTERCERRLDVPEFIALARALGHDPCTLLRTVEMTMSHASASE
ncbi:MAG TPA: helix-turn-helix transcriptional regulator [Rhodanobacteraceae bacterium]|nr:helix-turn-helix transcriptional regulator [Rhodanobacteraceae bacterium]